MVFIGQEEIVRALKRFKGIAKQELLANDLPESSLRKTHAEARREIYAQLIELIEQSGVENACVFAFNRYVDLPENNIEPLVKGHTHALEMFFNIIGINSEQLKQMKSDHINPTQIINQITYPESFICSQ